MPQPVIPQPPVLTGDQASDFWRYVQWLQSFYKATVLERVATLAGTFEISGTDNSIVVTLPKAVVGLDQPDDVFSPVCSAVSFTGSPDANAFTIQSAVAESRTTFRATLAAAPGVGASVIFSYVVVRSE